MSVRYSAECPRGEPLVLAKGRLVMLQLNRLAPFPWDFVTTANLSLNDTWKLTILKVIGESQTFTNERSAHLFRKENLAIVFYARII